jgi:hypothetical protein
LGWVKVYKNYRIRIFHLTEEGVVVLCLSL